MAMRFGHMIRSHVRINNLSGVWTSLRGRSYCSKSLSSRVPEDSADSLLKSKVIAFSAAPSTFGLWALYVYHYDFLYLRTLYVERKAEKEVLELLGRLDREKFESEDAYLEMLEREVNALKEKISERKTDRFELKIYRREMAVLNEKIKTSLANENNPPQAV